MCGFSGIFLQQENSLIIGYKSLVVVLRCRSSVVECSSLLLPAKTGEGERESEGVAIGGGGCSSLAVYVCEGESGRRRCPASAQVWG